MTPAMFGVFIIMLVYLPIFALSGVEGKMFQPMAFTVIAALLGALVLAITFIPACYCFVCQWQSVGKRKCPDVGVTPQLSTSVGLVDKNAACWCQPVAILLLISALWSASKMGSEFLPQLDEGDIAMHALRIPGTSLSQSVHMQMQLEARDCRPCRKWRGCSQKLARQKWRPDPMPPNVADTFIIHEKPAGLAQSGENPC